jgi:GNAT superfamily N-acetyltransferase
VGASRRRRDPSGVTRFVTLAERPDLAGDVSRLTASLWPPEMEFIQHDPVCGRHWPALYRTFAEFQPVLCDARGIVVAAGFTIPVAWTGHSRDLPSGVDGALERGVRGRARGRPPTALSALLAAVAPERQGRGLSAHVIGAMIALAARHRLRAVIAPVRPTLKHRYPTTPMRRYVRWTRSDGAPFDPWLRVHWRLGARLLRVAPRSMVITGSVAEWEAWTTMTFPESGRYVVPGALTLLHIDRRRNRGSHVEPNVWMSHPVRRRGT